MGIGAGERCWLIEIQERVEGRTASGAVETQWQAISRAPRMWARKQDRSGAQVQVAAGVREAGVVSTNFRTDWRSDLNQSMRIVCAGIVYDIKSVLDLAGDQSEIEIMTEMGRTNG